MIGLGTIVNVGTVLIGTTIGILLKNGLPKRFEKTVMQGLGLSTCFIGIGGTLSEVLTIQDGEIGTQHTMLLILCLALGAVIGCVRLRSRISSVLCRCNVNCRCIKRWSER